MSTQSITDAPKQTSAARIAANKANAQKATGPRTTEGKAAVANNAYKHGVRSERNPVDLAEQTTLPHEHEEFLATLEALKEDLQPQGILETRLVERLAHLDLRLTRAAKMEMTHLDISARRVHKQSANALPDEDPARLNWLTTLALLHTPNAMDLIGRYESRLTRDFAKVLTQLRQSQKLRVEKDVQKLRKQTQPQPIATTGQHAARYHVSDDVVQSDERAAQPTPPDRPWSGDLRSILLKGLASSAAARHRAAGYSRGCRGR